MKLHLGRGAWRTWGSGTVSAGSNFKMQSWKSVLGEYRHGKLGRQLGRGIVHRTKSKKANRHNRDGETAIWGKMN